MQFEAGGPTDCEFKLTLYPSGDLSLECDVPITVEIARIGIKQLEEDQSDVSKASFNGQTSNGGKVHIEEAFLDEMTCNDHKSRSHDDQNIKYIVDLDRLGEKEQHIQNYISKIWDVTGNLTPVPSHGKWIMKAHMTFIIIKEVKIDFKSVNQDDSVKATWGLTNLQFAGCEKGVAEQYQDSFRINVDNRTFTFSHVDDYWQKIKQLRDTTGIDVTANVIAETKYSELRQIEYTLEKVCYLLTFAAMNLVTRLFKDILKDGQLISTTLLPYFTIPFKKAYYLIDVRDGDNCQLKRFLETTYPKYVELESTFHLRYVIEYYISTPRAHSSENRFTIGYVGLNCLASNAPEYAKQHGDELKNEGSVPAREEDIKRVLNDRDQSLPADLIRALAAAVAYKEIGDEIKTKYLISKFRVEFDEKVLHKIVSFRGKFMHTGMDKKGKAWTYSQNILALIERILLAMLEWKGEYIDKLSGFTVRTLN